MTHVLVTGGCGYIGCQLVPALLQSGYHVRVIDRQYFGDRLPRPGGTSASLAVRHGDIRVEAELAAALEGIDSVIHLAAMSNDPAAEIDPEFTRSVNLDATLNLIRLAKAGGVSRFINASTATVYGIRDETDVDETFEHRPISLYGIYKSETDRYLTAESDAKFAGVNLRAGTVCGWSPRTRLDLTVNIFAANAYANGVVHVHGGQQKRPNVVIDDLVRAYLLLLSAPVELVQGESFNVAASNYSVLDIARRVAAAVRPDCQIIVEAVADRRSYHVTSAKIAERLGFHCHLSIEDGARQISKALRDTRIGDPSASEYFNLRHLMETGAVGGTARP